MFVIEEKEGSSFILKNTHFQIIIRDPRPGMATLAFRTIIFGLGQNHSQFLLRRDPLIVYDTPIISRIVHIQFKRQFDISIKRRLKSNSRCNKSASKYSHENT